MIDQRTPGVEYGHGQDRQDDRDDDLHTAWLDGLSRFGCVFLKLPRNKKHPLRAFEYFENLHQSMESGHAEFARTWLAEGYGLGFLPRGGLWVLDVDTKEWVDLVFELLAEALIFPPFLRTPGGGAHFYFRLPQAFRQPELKHHVCHPLDPDGIQMPIDFKFGPRSLVVAPGTTRHGKEYAPAIEWRDPPELAPTFFAPEVQFFKGPGQSFMADPRPLENRLARACTYLHSRKTRVSCSGMGGRRALALAASHLVAFLGLEPNLAVKFLTRGRSSWNSRCHWPNGMPYPWSRAELLDACETAVDSVPAAGVALLLEQTERGRRDGVLDQFVGLLRSAMPVVGGQRTRTEDLRIQFQHWSGTEITETAFGLALRRHGIERKKFTSAKVVGIPGVDTVLLASYLLRKEPTLINSNPLHLEKA